MFLLVVANGRWIFPPATWIAPIAWLLFLERSRALTGLLIGGVAYVGVQFVAWDGLIPAPGILFFLIAGAYGLIYFLPFAAHRLLARRVAGFAQTLVFPLAWVTTELVLQRWITPYGSWFSLPYTQANSLVLAQLASVTGIWGISFLMTWFAAVVVWSLTGRQTAAERRGGLALVTAAIIGVLLFGYARLAVRPVEEQATVRVAGLVPSAPLMDELESAFRSAGRRRHRRLVRDGRTHHETT
jgi:apolipoprotein N-acyltransferase